MPNSITNLPKDQAELKYQTNWVKIFSSNPQKVLDYWKTYRHFDEINQIVNFDKDKIILDIGCGISTILHFLPGTKYGIDPLTNTYKTIYKYPSDLNIIQSFAEKQPFPDNKFDIIMCSNALDHCDCIGLVLNEVYRCLKPNGFFVVAVEIFTQKKDRGKAHPYCWHDYEILDLVKEKFDILYKEICPWVGLREFYQNNLKNEENEILFIGKKK